MGFCTAHTRREPIKGIDKIGLRNKNPRGIGNERHAVAEYFVAIGAVLLLALCSVVAGKRLPPNDLLPMQWNLQKQVTWSAPRWIALSFTPALGAAVLLATAVSLDAAERNGESKGIGTLIFVAIAFLAGHPLHLWLLHRRLPH